MVNVVLFDDNAVIRIARRAVDFFSNYKGYRTTQNTIWLSGMYIKFTPRMLVLNVFDASAFSENEIIECLKNILLGEEVFVSDNGQLQKYIDEVNISTAFGLHFTRSTYEAN